MCSITYLQEYGRMLIPKDDINFDTTLISGPCTRIIYKCDNLLPVYITGLLNFEYNSKIIQSVMQLDFIQSTEKFCRNGTRNITRCTMNIHKHLFSFF